MSYIIHTLADISCIQRLSTWPVKLGFTLVTVYSLSIMLTILAFAPSFVQTVDIQRQTLVIHGWIVFTVIRVTEAVASCKVMNMLEKY